MTEPRPQGRPLSELRAIVAADQDLWDRIGEAWPYLSEQTKHQLVTVAESEALEDPEFEQVHAT